MADPWQECLDTAVAVARKAGEVIREALKKEMSVMLKSSPADLVTETDQKVESMIISTIKEKFPSHSFIGEESVAAGEGCTLTDNPTWIIDPIDGTTNFVHRFPFVTVSIGLAVKKEIELGVVYSCVEEKMYTGRKGKGAFCNGQKLKVSGQEDITKSLIITEVGSCRKPEFIKTVVSNMEKLLCIPVHGIRAVGTAAVNMCIVATGGADAYYEMGIHCWDIAAAAVIVREAGGVVIDTAGGTFDLMSRKVIAASSKAIAERIAKEVKEVPLERDE
ncbi:inositol monophosphatase 1 [Latimeria chalumnae]|uniref:inositol monophosphatase 1 n=1 Tax=Latimeria chalumnae TaxID=7897 RepID=UPI0006D91AB0|nr:PREDICTED: inositol monophosphatase 1 [Latimeria chalumnae]|eukprot:XP_014352058.1 PREDICTED: inositol monophosphatase 1 [Latimeria chalumnae]